MLSHKHGASEPKSKRGVPGWQILSEMQRSCLGLLRMRAWIQSFQSNGNVVQGRLYNSMFLTGIVTEQGMVISSRMLHHKNVAEEGEATQLYTSMIVNVHNSPSVA